MSANNEISESVRLPKSVPVMLLFGALVWVVTFIWGLSQRDSDLSYSTRDIQRLELNVNRLETEFASIRESVQRQAVATARIEESTKSINQNIEALGRQIERKFAEANL